MTNFSGQVNIFNCLNLQFWHQNKGLYSIKDEEKNQLKSQLCKQPLYCSIELVYFKKFHPWLVWFCSLVVKITKNQTEVWKIKTLCLKKCEKEQKKSWKHIVKFTGKQGQVCFVLRFFFNIWIILWHVRKKTK